MSGGQSGQQVLRFHADGLVLGHGKDHVDRLTGDLVEHIRRIAKIETEYSNDTSHGRLVDIPAMPKHVTDPGGIDIEPDIPGKIDVIQFLQGLDDNIDADYMRDPALHRLRKRLEPFATGGQIERHVEPVAALP